MEPKSSPTNSQSKSEKSAEQDLTIPSKIPTKSENLKKQNPYFGHWGEMYGYYKDDSPRNVVASDLRGF
jgi:hypothetical protein